MIIDPWGSLEITNYEKLFKQFGLERFSTKFNLKHRFFERNIVIAHRDFQKVLTRIKRKKPFINMTGIASSGPLHLGHKTIIDFFILFKKLGAKNYFAVANIDSYVSRPQVRSLKNSNLWAIENLAHALALGLDKKDVYIQTKKEQRYYSFAFELSKKITQNMFKAIYGHLDLGKVSANLLQFADIIHPQLKEYEGKMPSITVIGLEQDPHGKLTRDLARRLQYPLELPSFIYVKCQSGLQKGRKMSASEPDTAILLSDKPNEVKRKISKAFTGGRDTIEEQKKLGGNPDICKIYEIFKYHHEDSKFVEKIYTKCKKGTLLCKECKQLCENFLNKFLKSHQKKLQKTQKIAEKLIKN